MFKNERLELTVLYQLMLNDSMRKAFFPLLKGLHFQSDLGKLTFSCFQWMLEQGADTLDDEALQNQWCKTNKTTVQKYFEDTKTEKIDYNFDEFTGVLSEMTLNSFSNADPENMMTWIVQLDNLRRANWHYTKISKLVDVTKENDYKLIDAGEYLKRAATATQKAISGGLRHEYRSTMEVCADITQEFIEEKKPDTDFIATGIGRLDNKVKGLRWDALNILAARPGIGKTNLSMQIGQNVAKADGSILMIGLEMESRLLIYRMIAQVTGIDTDLVEAHSPIHTGRITTELYNISNSWEIVDSCEHDIGSIEFTLRTELEKKQFDLIIVDHLQEIQHTDRWAKRHEAVGLICDVLKDIGREYRTPVLLVCQLRRTDDAKQKKRPSLSQLKESSDIEQKAGIVLFLHRPDRHGEESEILIGKNRYGPTGIVPMWFEKSCTRFTERINE